MSDRLVTIATFQDPVAAALAKNFLENEEIPAILLDESTVATNWSLAGAIGGIKLQVPAIHVERAELMLAQIQAEKLTDEEAEAPAASFATAETAEELRAEEEDKAPINQLADRIYRSAIFGLIFWPLQAYVLYLLLQVLAMPGKVSRNRRWKMWVAVLLNLPILFVLLYVLSFAFSGCESAPSTRWGWQEGPEGRFQIKMPGKAILSEYRLPSSHGPLIIQGIQSSSAELGFFAAVSDLPKTMSRVTPKEVLEEVAKLHLFDQRERYLAQSDFAFGDFHAMEGTIESVGYQRRILVYYRRETIYVLGISGPPDLLRSAEAERFVQSMRWR